MPGGVRETEDEEQAVRQYIPYDNPQLPFTQAGEVRSPRNFQPCNRHHEHPQRNSETTRQSSEHRREDDDPQVPAQVPQVAGEPAAVPGRRERVHDRNKPSRGSGKTEPVDDDAGPVGRRLKDASCADSQAVKPERQENASRPPGDDCAERLPGSGLGNQRAADEEHHRDGWEERDPCNPQRMPRDDAGEGRGPRSKSRLGSRRVT